MSDRWVAYFDEKGNEAGMLLPADYPLEVLLSIANRDKHVLITGETGSGKDSLARFIVQNSKRHKQKRNVPFEAINCAALTSYEMFASELFGMTQGAATGVSERSGIFARCDGGSVLLEEIGELTPEKQAVLLQFIQTGYCRPVGADASRKLDVRVIATTNADVEQSDSFRPDLLYRFGTSRIDLKPLRESPEDIPVLMAHKMEPWDSYNAISLEWLLVLLQYSWLGNLRQLNDYCEAVTLAHFRVKDTETETRTHGQLTTLDKDSPVGGKVLDFNSSELEGKGCHSLSQVASFLLWLHEAEHGDAVIKSAAARPALARGLRLLAGVSALGDDDLRIPFVWLLSDPYTYAIACGENRWRHELGVVEFLARLLNWSRDPSSIYTDPPLEIAIALNTDYVSEAIGSVLPSEHFYNQIINLPEAIPPQPLSVPMTSVHSPLPITKSKGGRPSGSFDMTDDVFAGHVINSCDLGWNALLRTLRLKDLKTGKLIPKYQRADSFAKRVNRMRDSELHPKVLAALKKVVDLPEEVRGRLQL